MDTDTVGRHARRRSTKHGSRALLAAALASLAALLVRPAAAQAQGEPESAQADAMQAYRDSLAAFERGDADAYFGAFADPLLCFYGRMETPRARVQQDRRALLAQNRAHPGRSRLVSEELDVVRGSAERVVLSDRGLHGRAGRERSHDKAVLMVHSGSRWRIAAEGGRGSRCYDELMRSEIVTGVDPLATEDGVWTALRQPEDLIPTGRGLLDIDARGRWSSAYCVTLEETPPNAPRSSFSCDAGVDRCVLGGTVYRFGRVGEHRQLLAVVRYADAGAVPARESRQAETLLRGRDTLCELLDRVSRADPSLVSDDVWQLQGEYESYHPPIHLCGEAARRVSRQVLQHFSGNDMPLICSATRCGFRVDATGDPHLEARRTDGHLRLSVDGRDWVSGDNVSSRDRARMEQERCPVAP